MKMFKSIAMVSMLLFFCTSSIVFADVAILGMKLLDVEKPIVLSTEDGGHPRGFILDTPNGKYHIVLPGRVRVEYLCSPIDKKKRYYNMNFPSVFLDNLEWEPLRDADNVLKELRKICK